MPLHPATYNALYVLNKSPAKQLVLWQEVLEGSNREASEGSYVLSFNKCLFNDIRCQALAWVLVTQDTYPILKLLGALGNGEKVNKQRDKA